MIQFIHLWQFYARLCKLAIYQNLACCSFNLQRIKNLRFILIEMRKFLFSFFYFQLFSLFPEFFQNICIILMFSQLTLYVLHQQLSFTSKSVLIPSFFRRILIFHYYFPMWKHRTVDMHFFQFQRILFLISEIVYFIIQFSNLIKQNSRGLQLCIVKNYKSESIKISSLYNKNQNTWIRKLIDKNYNKKQIRKLLQNVHYVKLLQFAGNKQKNYKIHKMENYYKKAMFDICQLIKQKSYKRAITLCEFMLSKGFKTNELIVILSYGKKMIDGPKIGLKVLKEYAQSHNQNQVQKEKTNFKSPLIQLAVTQYNIENQSIKQALQILNQFVLDQKNTNGCNNQQTQPNQLFEMLSSLKGNYKKIFFSTQEQIQNFNNGTYHDLNNRRQPNQNNGFQTNENKQTQSNQNNESWDKQKIVQKFTRQINEITISFLKEKQIETKKSLDQFCPQIILKYGEFYLQYDDVKQRILAILSNQLRFDSKKIFNVSMKKGKMSQTKLRNNKQRIKKQNIKELFFKQIKPVCSQKYGNLFSAKNEKKDEQKSISQKYLNQLKILLKTTNKFISFMKNRLGEYGNSRVKQFVGQNCQKIAKPIQNQII